MQGVGGYILKQGTRKNYDLDWTNGDPNFTEGPPVKDAVMRVKGVAFYYKTEEHPGLPYGCSLEKACRV